MGIQYDPEAIDKAEAARRCWAIGIYDATCIGAEEKTSKTNLPMLKVQLRVYNDAGGTLMIDDYLLPTHPTVSYRFKHFCEAAGLDAEYQSGTITADTCLNRDVKVKLGIEKQEGYDERSKVADYLTAAKAQEAKDKASKPKASRGKAPPKPAPIKSDSEIPF